MCELPSQLPLDYRPVAVSNEYGLVCSKCGKPPISPTMRLCGCIVCSACQVTADEICQIHYTSYGQIVDLPYDYVEAFNKITIKCPFEGLGCDKIIRLADFEQHANECEYSMVKCPYCSAPGMRANFGNHYAACPRIPHRCALCG